MIPFVAFGILGIILMVADRKGWGALCLAIAFLSVVIMAVG